MTQCLREANFSMTLLVEVRDGFDKILLPEEGLESPHVEKPLPDSSVVIGVVMRIFRRATVSEKVS